jgi:hypothetical protein
MLFYSDAFFNVKIALKLTAAIYIFKTISGVIAPNPVKKRRRKKGGRGAPQFV